MVLAHSHQIPRARCYSGSLLMVITMFRIRDYNPMLCNFPIVFCYITIFHFITGPNPWYITMSGLGSYPFARHYLGNRLFTFFSSRYLDGSVPWVPFLTLCIDVRILAHYRKWVTSFRNLRITVYLQLPVAYRSLSRLSSAPSAKASAIRPS